MGSAHGLFGVLIRCVFGDGMVKSHDDVRSDIQLGLGGSFWREKVSGAVDVGLELGPFVGNFGV